MQGAPTSSEDACFREMEVEIEKNGRSAGPIQMRLLELNSTIADLVATIPRVEDTPGVKSSVTCMLGRDTEDVREVLERDWPRWTIRRIPERHTRITLRLTVERTRPPGSQGELARTPTDEDKSPEVRVPLLTVTTRLPVACMCVLRVHVCEGGG